MRTKRIKVSQEFLDQCSDQYCADTLDMYEPAKSVGKVIAWKRRHWVCIAGASKNLTNLEATLCQCVPEAEYQGTPYHYSFENEDGWGDPDAYYVGGTFRCKGQIWVMTDLEITLVPFSQERRRHAIPSIS